jgi:hypothetical protein
MGELADTIKRMATGALKGGLITGGIGAGIPTAWHASNNSLDSGGLAQAGRFGLVSAIPGALIGAILAAPGSNGKPQDLDFYGGSLDKKNGKLYKDLIELYNENSLHDLTTEEFRQLYNR